MDDVARRREARRRKILENSQGRLSKITGIEQKTQRAPSCEHVTEPETELPQPRLNDTFPHSNDFKPPQELKPPNTPHRHITIMGLAFFVHLLHVISAHFLDIDLHETQFDKIFLPLFIYEAVNLLGGQSDTPRTFLHSLLDATMKDSPLVRVVRHLEFVTVLFQDVMVYFFFYVCCEFIKSFFVIVLR